MSTLLQKQERHDDLDKWYDFTTSKSKQTLEERVNKIDASMQGVVDAFDRNARNNSQLFDVINSRLEYLENRLMGNGTRAKPATTRDNTKPLFTEPPPS